MKTNLMIKNTITIIFLIVLIVSCKEDKKKDKTEVEPIQKEIIIKEPLRKKQLIGNPLETLKTSYYDDKGIFFREIMIPTVVLNGQRNSSYDLIIKLQKDISSNGNYILFELYQNGNTDQREMKNDLVKQNIPEIKANHFSNFKPSDRTNVYVFSYHDEEFITYSDEIKNNIYKYIQEVVKNCVDSSSNNCEPRVNENEIIKIINPNIIDKLKPNTIGGGVIPPK